MGVGLKNNVLYVVGLFPVMTSVEVKALRFQNIISP